MNTGGEYVILFYVLIFAGYVLFNYVLKIDWLDLFSKPYRPDLKPNSTPHYIEKLRLGDECYFHSSEKSSPSFGVITHMMKTTVNGYSHHTYSFLDTRTKRTWDEVTENQILSPEEIFNLKHEKKLIDAVDDMELL